MVLIKWSFEVKDKTYGKLYFKIYSISLLKILKKIYVHVNISMLNLHQIDLF